MHIVPNITPERALTISPTDKDVLYTVGYTFYLDQKYSDAIVFFTALIFYEPANVKYYAALAACQKMTKDYANAIYNYTLMMLMQPEKLEHALHIAECQIACHDISNAIDTLTILLEMEAEFPHDLNIQTAKTWLTILHAECA